MRIRLPSGVRVSILRARLLIHTLIKFCKVKWGNLERKLDFGTCCSRKFCSKSEIMFVWEAHSSKVKANRSCLTLLLYLWHTADN